MVIIYYVILFMNDKTPIRKFVDDVVDQQFIKQFETEVCNWKTGEGGEEHDHFQSMLKGLISLQIQSFDFLIDDTTFNCHFYYVLKPVKEGNCDCNQDALSCSKKVYFAYTLYRKQLTYPQMEKNFSEIKEYL